MTYPTDILKLDANELHLRSHNPGEPVDIVLVAAPGEALPEAPPPSKRPVMLPAVEVSCPYCGELLTLVVDDSAGAQSYIEDCQVCCRPMMVRVQYRRRRRCRRRRRAAKTRPERARTRVTHRLRVLTAAGEGCVVFSRSRCRAVRDNFGTRHIHGSIASPIMGLP